ncbi:MULTISPECIES: hypothetical protein [Aerosakkonema]|uniref:hypothetical protein n=1 Tax=Aerosakkonema TaxID=1246629 RepID=UPI0035BA2EBF
MAAKKLATFRIDPNKWQAFQQWAKRSGTNASALLTEYIDGCLDIPPTRVSRFSIDRNNDVSLEQRMDELEQRLKDLQSSMEASIKQAVETQLANLQNQVSQSEQK